MRLGIVVTDAAYLDVTRRLLDAANARDWRAECFLTDTGVLLLADAGFVDRVRARPGSVSVCEHSIELHADGAFDSQALADDIVIGGQYQDAELVKRCDKILVF
jgi:hypothetical protein